MTEEDDQKPTEDQLQQLCQLADQLKLAGNMALQKGNADEAVQLYTQGIEAALATGDRATRCLSVLYSNRAAVRLTQKKFVEVVGDCRKSINADVSNMKAYWRAARASIGLELWQQAVEFCESGLAQDSSHLELQSLLQSAREQLAQFRERKEAANRKFTEEEATHSQAMVKELSEQLGMISQKQASLEYENVRATRTLSVLKEMDESVNCYKTFGRGFVYESKSEIVNQLQDRCASIQSKELPETIESKKLIEGRKLNADNELKEIIKYFKNSRQ